MANDKKAAFGACMRALSEMLSEYGFDYLEKAKTFKRDRGRFKDILVFNHLTRGGNEATLQVGIESIERLEAEERLSFLWPKSLLFFNFITDFIPADYATQGDYILDRGTQVVASEIRSDVTNIVLPLLKVTDLIDQYEAKLYLHPCFRKGPVDHGVSSLYFARERPEEAIAFLRGLERQYLRPDNFLKSYEFILNGGGPGMNGWNSSAMIAEQFYRYGIDPKALFEK